jgi:hypothetical protein
MIIRLFYCNQHLDQNVNLTFKFHETIISFKVNNTISSIRTILNDITIHDCFLNNQNLIVYLLSRSMCYLFQNYKNNIMLPLIRR